jgi:predicted RNA-binding Zn ribbon-like protein
MPPRVFEFRAGARSLDLVDTVAGRSSAEPVDLLSTPHDLERWLHLAGLVRAPAGAIRAVDLETTRSLRESIYRTAKAVSEGAALEEKDVALLNATASKSPARPQLNKGVVTYRAANAVEAALSALAADAIECFGSERRDRVRTCPECRMIFFDTSRPGQRRWCSSASGCGNRAKVRRHRQRTSRSQEEHKRD